MKVYTEKELFSMDFRSYLRAIVEIENDAWELGVYVEVNMSTTAKVYELVDLQKRLARPRILRDAANVANASMLSVLEGRA